jgi:hypothetical protein
MGISFHGKNSLYSVLTDAVFSYATAALVIFDDIPKKSRHVLDKLRLFCYNEDNYRYP